jgi:hypothetical protein
MGSRPLNSKECELLERLLSADIPGRSELQLQLRHSQVEPIDSNGSLRFEVNLDSLASVPRRIPVESQCKDVDGTWIHALLHVVGGKLTELEIYKDDSSAVIRMPERDDWEVIVP